jgi:hypothetical protein
MQIEDDKTLEQLRLLKGGAETRLSKLIAAHFMTLFTER